jgi:hypothetical protein
LRHVNANLSLFRQPKQGENVVRDDIRRFLDQVDRYLRVADIKESTLSTRCMGSGGRIAKIRNGEYTPRAASVQRAQQWMRDHPAERYHQLFPRGNPNWKADK